MLFHRSRIRSCRTTPNYVSGLMTLKYTFKLCSRLRHLELKLRPQELNIKTRFFNGEGNSGKQHPKIAVEKLVYYNKSVCKKIESNKKRAASPSPDLQSRRPSKFNSVFLDIYVTADVHSRSVPHKGQDQPTLEHRKERTASIRRPTHITSCINNL